MADQKISELQLVVATGVAATGIYVPLYTPMLAPANRRISAAEFFKTPKRIEVSDSALAGTGEIMTLTTSYGTASLRVGTGGQFILGGNLAAIGEVAVVSDSSALKLGILSDVGFLRSASGVARVIDVSTSNYGALEAKRFLANYGTISGATIPIISGSQTWSDASNIFTAVLVNVTDTNSNSASKLLDLQVGGSSRFSASKTGIFSVSNGSKTISIDTNSVPVQLSTDQLSMILVNSVWGINVNTAGVYTSGGSYIGFGTTGDVYSGVGLTLYRDTNDILALRRLANANQLRVYETASGSPGTDFSRGVFGFKDSAGASTTTLRIGTEAGGTFAATPRAVSIVTGAVERINLPASSGSAVTITSYDFSQGNVLSLTSPSGTAAMRVGAGGQLVLPGSIATVGGLSQISNTVPLYLGLSSDVGFLRTASGLVQVTNIGTGLGSLQARYLYASGAPTITADAPALTVSQRWDNAGVNFNGMIFDFIPQNAGSSSKLVDFRVSGVSYTSISQFGDVSSSSFTVAGNSATMRTSQFKLRDTGQFVWTNSSSAIGTEDTGLARASSGVIRVTDGSSGTGSITVRNTNSTVYTITDGTGVDINPASGAIQVWTLGATRTPTANNFNAGQSVTLMVDDGSGFSINWGTMAVSWLNSTPPALPTSGYGVVELWKVGSTIYGTSVGNVV